MANEIANTQNATIIDETAFNIPQGYVCTLDMATQEGKIQVARALNGSNPLKDRMGETLHVKGIITTPGTRAVSGSECTNNYIVIEEDDGSDNVLFSQSDGVTRSLKVIVALWGQQLSAGETVDVQCVEQKLNNGNTLKTIVPA